MRTFLRIAWRAGCLLLAMVLVWLSMGMSAAAAEEELVPSDEPVEVAELAPDVTLPRDRVTLVADGVREEFSAELGTVENLLKVAGVELGEYDIVRPSASAELEGGTEVVVLRAETRTVTCSIGIPFDVERIPNEYIPKGTENVLREGKAGLEVTTYTVTEVDGEIVAATAAVVETVREPVAKVVEYGPGGTLVTPDGRTLEWSYKIDGVATAYTTENSTDKTNATGRVARAGTIAVDPRVIPLGSKVYVASREGARRNWSYGECVAEDTGGAIKGNIVDLYYDTVNQCLSFGRQKCTIYVFGK